jgi:hypothetical protein
MRSSLAFLSYAHRYLCALGFVANSFSLAAAVPVAQTQIQYLSGRGTDDAVPWNFQVSAGMKAGQAAMIPVPGCWELHGFGGYSYGHDKEQPSETGLYARAFDIPTDWQGRRVFLVFEGVMTDCEARVNGQAAGPVHQGSFYRFQHEITSLLKFGSANQLEVTVHKESANTSVNRAERRGDYWNFGGIFRPVWLKAEPATFVERVALDARADGKFSLTAHLGGDLKATRLMAEIIGADGAAVGQAFEAAIEPAAKSVTLQTQVSHPRLWTAETPNLHTVRLTLMAGKQPLHVKEQRFGFRTVEVKPGDGVYVNGQKVRFKGTCRHTFHPDTGRASSPAISRGDIQLMKEMNMNAVRMSHYPPDEHFLDLCDELGLYVLDELAGWQKSYDADIGAKLLEEMIQRDVNHPAIVFWDNANEGGWNTALDDLFAQQDPQKRQVLHPWGRFGPMDTKHYAIYSQVVSALASNYIYMPTEFLHGLYDGGQGAGLEDYWNLFLASPRAAGGFTWAFLDEAVKRTDENGRLDSHGNNAPDGILGPHREKKGSFYTIKEIWCPMRVTAPKLDASFDGSIAVQNGYDFTDLSTCKVAWSLVKFPLPAEVTTNAQVLSQGQISGPKLAPGAKGSIKLPLPKDWQQAEALRFSAIGPAGQELYSWSWPIVKAADLCRKIVPASTQSARGEMQGETIQVKAGLVELVFSRQDGRLQQVKASGREIPFSGGPLLVADKHPERSNKKSSGDKKSEPPKIQSATTTVKNVTGKAEGNDYVIRAEYEGAMKFHEWRVLGNGWVRLQYAYELNGDYDYFGVSFTCPEQTVTGMKWLGDGPYRVWKNRRAGVPFGVWQKPFNDTIAGETWEYPEFKGYHAGFRWAEIQTRAGAFLIAAGQDDLFLRLYTPKTEADPVSARMLMPSGDISLLHAITPIGNKFHKAADTGPMGQRNQAAGVYQGELYFQFSK